MNRDRVSSEGPAPRGAAQTSSDNSGLIDLRALMAAAKSASREEPREEAVDSGDVGHLAVYPLGAPLSQRQPAPPAPVAVPVPEPARAGRGQTIFAVAAVLVLACVAAGAIALLVGGAPTKTAVDARADNAGQTLQTPAENAKIDVAPAGDPRREPVAGERERAPVDTTGPGADTSPETRVRPGTPGPLPKPGKVPGAQKTVPETKKTPVKPPAGDPCKGDLLCAMKRSTEHH